LGDGGIPLGDVFHRLRNRPVSSKSFRAPLRVD
jgi:hypothetical protein